MNNPENEKYLNKENETGENAPRRRRRSNVNPEETVLQAEAGHPAETAAKAADTADAVVSAAQAADSRVPPEARRMSALPYGTGGSAIARRPGTRPVQAARRPVQEAEPARPARRPASSAADTAGDADKTQSFDTSKVSGAAGSSGQNRVSVGYAPGRMSMPPRNAQAYGRNAQPAQETSRSPRTAQDYVQDIRNAQDYGRDPRQARTVPDNRRPRRPKRHPLLWMITALLILTGTALTVILTLPEDNTLRVRAGEFAGRITQPLQGLFGKKITDSRLITAFSVTGNEKTTAPADVIFSVTTDPAVKELRLADEDGVDLEAGQTLVENTGSNSWTLTFRVKNGYEGLVKLQMRPDGSDGAWTDTEYSALIAIAPPLAAAEPSGTAAPAAEETPVNAQAQEPAGNPEEPQGEDAEAIPEEQPEENTEETPGEDPGEEPEKAAEEQPGEDRDAAAEDYGDDLWGVPWGGNTEAAPTDTPEPTPSPTETPEPTPEPTPTPPLTAEADISASPELIVSTTVYDGSKKIKSYVRPAKSLIHMPAGDDYTVKKIGVLTFRGNAFRQNAAVGEIVSADGLTLLWTAEAGSSRGASQTFYGYEWTGQPAIVKWSTQVRAGSNIDEDKKNKTALREVIIAGVDGVIRFLDLEDGTLTRSAINMGYPMKGTPSLHPAGYPYMNVGQYTRKMKNKTGTIGLRQYNLYNQKELKLIDGLDGKLHRGINRIGSFETSSLIDRTSDTMVTLGTNGLLYLTSLNTSFDYQAATLSINSSTIVMASKAKGQKKTELVAVESSHAMYDRYVYYADMGGILRCVDTNFLSTVWAADTGDAVKAAIALDLNGEDGLDLYTANMLANRKKGNAQIRRYDALSGKEIWNLEIGVAKNTKTKEEVGVKASPVIGQKGLSELVYFTVTGLNEEGRAALGISVEAKAAIAAIEKKTGRIRWAAALSDRSESSPVAVYDSEGNGFIVQCSEDGMVLLLDGLTGSKRAELQINGEILASPAAYNDILVVGTSGKGTESVVGIRIR